LAASLPMRSSKESMISSLRVRKAERLFVASSC
jgi:hypothetical protein